MKQLWTLIKAEPAMVAAVIVALLQVVLGWDEAQAAGYRDLIIQVIVTLGGGVAVRQSVTPTSKRSGSLPR